MPPHPKPRAQRAPAFGASTALLAFFGIAAVLLTSVVPAVWALARHAARARQAAIGDACTAIISNTAGSDRQIAQMTLEDLRRKYRLEAIEVRNPNQPPLISGDPRRVPDPAGMEARAIGPTTVRIWFAQGLLEDVSRLVRFGMVAGVVAAVCGLLLLPLYVLEAFRGAAPQESDPEGDASLLHTFSRLHLQEKGRADELARLTATLVRSLTSGFIALDEHGRVVDLNQAAREVLRLPPETAVLGREVGEALGASSFARTLAAAHQRRAAVQRREVTTGGDEPAVIGVSTVPLLDEQGRYLGMLALFADLTDVRKLERRVRDMQALADVGEMSAGIAHEFRNSLATILGYLRLASRDAAAAGNEERLRKAEQEALGLSAAVERLLALGRPLNPRREPLELRGLAEEIATRLAPLAEEIDFRVGGDEIRIDGDAALLSRALENVVRNAMESIQSRGGRGRVVITTTNGATRRMTIEDDGAGIDPAVRLFVPFQSGKPSGFGLGLTLAKRIILLHHGTIRLSPRPAGGAVAEIELDLAPEPVDDWYNL
jgi:signal transduction histidine kinase